MSSTTNVFSGGMAKDKHPLALSNKEYTDALNATFVTYNGNELMLLNDMGNTMIQDAKTGNIMGLREGFIPVGMKEHGGIMYIASVNKDGVGEIGSIPSPVIRFDLGERVLEDGGKMNISNYGDCSTLIVLTENKLTSGEKFAISLDINNDEEDVVEVLYNTDNSPELDNLSPIKYPLISYYNTENKKVYGLYNLKLFSQSEYNIYDLSDLIGKKYKYLIYGYDDEALRINNWYLNPRRITGLPETFRSHDLEFDVDNMLINDKTDVVDELKTKLVNVFNENNSDSKKVNIKCFMTYPCIQDGLLSVGCEYTKINKVELAKNESIDSDTPIIYKIGEDEYLVTIPEIVYETDSAIHVDEFNISIVNNKTQEEVINQNVKINDEVKRYKVKNKNIFRIFKIKDNYRHSYIDLIIDVNQKSSVINNSIIHFKTSELNTWYTLKIDCYNNKISEDVKGNKIIYVYTKLFNPYYNEVLKLNIDFKLTPQLLYFNVATDYYVDQVIKQDFPDPFTITMKASYTFEPSDARTELKLDFENLYNSFNLFKNYKYLMNCKPELKFTSQGEVITDLYYRSFLLYDRDENPNRNVSNKINNFNKVDAVKKLCFTTYHAYGTYLDTDGYRSALLNYHIDQIADDYAIDFTDPCDACLYPDKKIYDKGNGFKLPSPLNKNLGRAYGKDYKNDYYDQKFTGNLLSFLKEGTVADGDADSYPDNTNGGIVKTVNGTKTQTISVPMPFKQVYYLVIPQFNLVTKTGQPAGIYKNQPVVSNIDINKNYLKLMFDKVLYKDYWANMNTSLDDNIIKYFYYKNNNDIELNVKLEKDNIYYCNFNFLNNTGGYTIQFKYNSSDQNHCIILAVTYERPNVAFIVRNSDIHTLTIDNYTYSENPASISSAGLYKVNVPLNPITEYDWKLYNMLYATSKIESKEFTFVNLDSLGTIEDECYIENTDNYQFSDFNWLGSGLFTIKSKFNINSVKIIFNDIYHGSVNDIPVTENDGDNNFVVINDLDDNTVLINCSSLCNIAKIIIYHKNNNNEYVSETRMLTNEELNYIIPLRVFVFKEDDIYNFAKGNYFKYNDRNNLYIAEGYQKKVDDYEIDSTNGKYEFNTECIKQFKIKDYDLGEYQFRRLKRDDD